MGASNVLAAYAKWAGKVPPTSMQLLVYMAAVSKDSDRRPWFGQGHQALAQHALGRPAPTRGADIAAVERALAPLAKAGAITTDRRAAVRSDGPNTARYRLNLDPFGAPRNSLDVNPDETGTGSTVVTNEDPPRPTNSVAHVPRISESRPPNSVGTPPEFRGTEEYEEYEEREEQEQPTALVAAVTVTRARDSPTGRCDRHGLKAGTRADGSPMCTFCRVDARTATDPPHLRLVHGGAG